MSAHLSSEQISGWMAGDCAPDVDQHLRECSQCSAETARLKGLLAEFRSSVIATSARQKGAEAPERWTPPERRRSFSGVLRWKLAAAALAIAVIVPICKNSSDRRRQMEAFEADIQLWEEVNAQVSRPVPTPLEPLMKLVVWEPEAVVK
jgi:predicted anti-sigma-YlaC factor YlaD